MRGYKASNGRIIPRGRNGRFQRATLRDFGIGNDMLQDGYAICANCGHGEDPEKRWYPVLKTGICPNCDSTEKRK